MPLVEQELLTLSDHQVFSGDHVAKSFSFLCSVLSTIFYPFTFGHYICLFFFDLRLKVTPLVSSNCSFFRSHRGHGRMVVGFTTTFVPVQSVPITTNVVSSKPANWTSHR